MANTLINEQIKQIHTDLSNTLLQIQALTAEVRNAELERTVKDLQLRMGEPFLFVIVGEVKAGKSSFINALLSSSKEIAKVAPDPCTDSIQQLKYGDEPFEISVSDHYKQIYQPFDILKDISIVDTPGTNTIIDYHQEITERFVPVADLIVFVFEAKNPYRQSSWSFFDFIHSEWRKKVIFVLQQKDLVDPQSLEINIAGVTKTAVEKGIENPDVFAVSALQEQNADPESGFNQLRAFIEQNITNGNAPYFKLENIADSLKNINQRIYAGLVDRKKQYEADYAFRKDITSDLNNQELKSHQQVNNLTDNLLDGYDRVSERAARELRDGLSFFVLLSKSFKSIFKKNESPKLWLEELKADFETSLNAEMRDKLNDGVGELADSIQSMAKIIELKLRSNQTILTDTDDFFSHIAEKRKSVLQEVRDSFNQFMSKSESFTDDALFDSTKTIAPNIATGSGIAVIGVILTALTKGVVFDVTGGILTTVGLLFAGITAGLRRKKIVNGFREEIHKGRQSLENELTTALDTYIKNIRAKIEENFVDYDLMLTREKEAIDMIETKHDLVKEQLITSEIKIQQALSKA